jgi:hypothetical protein
MMLINVRLGEYQPPTQEGANERNESDCAVRVAQTPPEPQHIDPYIALSLTILYIRVHEHVLVLF